MKAITFDAVGTLFGLAEPVGQTYSRIARTHGWEIPATLLDRGFRAAWKSTAHLNLSHRCNFTLDPDTIERAWWRSLVENCFHDALKATESEAIPFRLSDALFADLFDHFGGAKAWSIFPEVVEVLEKLTPQYPLAVISNFDSRFHQVAEGLGLECYFRRVVLSGEAGCAKPAAFIFEMTAEALDVAPDQILHVGDDPDADWAGGRSAGFQVFELVRPDLSLRDLPLIL